MGYVALGFNVFLFGLRFAIRGPRSGPGPYENHVILGFGVLVVLLGLFARKTSFRPRGGPSYPGTKTLQIALVTYGVLVIILAISRFAGK